MTSLKKKKKKKRKEKKEKKWMSKSFVKMLVNGLVKRSCQPSQRDHRRFKALQNKTKRVLPTLQRAFHVLLLCVDHQT